MRAGGFHAAGCLRRAAQVSIADTLNYPVKKILSQRFGTDIDASPAHNPCMESFGKRLRAAREARGITQEALVFEVGVTSATVSKWETGRSEPTLEQIALLTGLLGRSADYFVLPDADMDEAAKAQDVRRALNVDEERLLARFRMLTPDRRQGLLALLSPEA